jgi:hypothetical protein
MRLKHDWPITAFGIIEIGTGFITLVALIISLSLGKSTKPPVVFFFVLTTATISFSLGLGILRYNLISYHILLYFSSIIILSKILIFAKIITLSGALETSVPQPLKNIASVIYHSLLIFYFTRPSVRRRFNQQREVL